MSGTEALPSRIGLIAAQGEFPLLIARAAASNGVEVTALAVQGFASTEMQDAATRTHWLELGQFNKLIELLHEEQLKHVILAGRIPHSSILQYRHFDFRAVKLLAKSINKKADTLLLAVTRELESEGIEILDSTLFLRTFMPQPGVLTSEREPSPQEMADVEFAWPIARAIAGQDVGQTIVVKDGTVVAVEAMEGTNDCIRRAAKLVGPGCIVVKVAKPRQDMRFDVPIVGMKTLEIMKHCGCSTLAISAKQSLILAKDDVVAFAQANGISIVAV